MDSDLFDSLRDAIVLIDPDKQYINMIGIDNR